MKTSYGWLYQKKLHALILGGILAVIVFVVGSLFGGFIIRRDTVIFPLYIAINIFSFLFCWLSLSLLVAKYPLYKIIVVLGLLLLVAVSEYFMDIPNNPVTIPLLMLFWMGVSYLILPAFFKKYKFIIFVVYGAVITYYLIFRSSPNYAEAYRPVVSNFLIISISMMVILWAYEQWKWLITLRAAKANAELALLKNQINPHFFFNTLNNLYGLAVEKSDETPAMILKLSDMMRYTIYDGKVDFVPLANEIAYMEDYIELHKIRYKRKVEITFKKDLSYSHEIAPLLFIVPLENAFKHGVESLAENAFVDIEINTTATKIFLQIKNNFEASGKENEGIGIDNLKKRLALIYPEKHVLEISNTSEIFKLNLSIEVT